MPKSRIRGVVFSFLGVTDGSVIPSVRIARKLGERLSLPVTDSSNFFNAWHALGHHREEDATLFLVNGAFGFCKILQELAGAILEARRVVWVQNDYTIIPPTPVSGAESPFRLAFRQRRDAGLPDIDYWTTIGVNARATPLSSYVNWNALAWNPLGPQQRAGLRNRASGDLFYYGSYRQGRKNYFERYLRMACSEMPVTVSSPGKGEFPNDKFVEAFPMCHHVGKMVGRLEPQLATRGLGVYAEDRRSHGEYHSPANRFYEMLGAGLPIVFQQECAATFRKAGMDVSPWIANTSIGVRNMMRRREDVGNEQRRALTRDFAEELNREIGEAVAKLEAAS